MIVGGEPVAKFVSDALDIGLCPPYFALGIEREGRVVAGVVFNCFEGADVHFTAAGTGWTREFMQAIGHYVFVLLDCERMTAVTESPKVAALGVKLGGEIEGRLRNHFGYGRDGIVIGVLRSEYRYAKVPEGLLTRN